LFEVVTMRELAKKLEYSPTVLYERELEGLSRNA
jgi:hypothetical protein